MSESENATPPASAAPSSTMSASPPTLWSPPVDPLTTRLGEFMAFCETRTGSRFADYDQLWKWSVTEGLEQCWAALWDFFQVDSDTAYRTVLDRRTMPGAHWFVGAELNYAEHIVRNAADWPDRDAVVGISQTRDRTVLSWADLVDRVARVRTWLVGAGVGTGDRVAAYLPNIPETIVAFLATASLGAIWTSCAPEFGVRAVLDRLSQVAPKVLFAVDGYRYGARDISRVAELAEIRAGLDSLTHTVIVEYGGGSTAVPDVTDWSTVLTTDADPLEFVRVEPEHPLYVLYSSGTTGLPKPIVHGHGGILIEHLKALGLHCDVGPGDRVFWFTTTGWMMWNFIVSGLLVGATVVTFDGDPSIPIPVGDGALAAATLWELIEAERLTLFGVGAPFITAASRAALRPGQRYDLSSLRLLGVTGAPLPAEGFDWVYESVAPDVQLSSMSGGTDVCSAFVGGSPLTPVWRGEIPCRYLGCAVAAYDEAGREVVNEQGELVITEPMPSMPIGFWGDGDGSRLRRSYFEEFPGVWRHGDWITVTDRGSCVITGRSDATLNRGGVRVGTAEIYRVVEAIAGVSDSLVVHLESATGDGPGELVLFVALDPAERDTAERDPAGIDPAGRDPVELDEELLATIRARVRSDCSPRHVPDSVYQIDAIPTTLSGKKLELPVKKILLGANPDQVASRGALKDPAALASVIAIAERRRSDA